MLLASTAHTLSWINTNKIDNVSVVHIGGGTNSSAMERQGLINSLASFESEGVKIKLLIEDSHVQIKAVMKT